MRGCVHMALPVLDGWREIDTLSVLFWIGRSVGRSAGRSIRLYLLLPPPTRSPQTHHPKNPTNRGEDRRQAPRGAAGGGRHDRPGGSHGHGALQRRDRADWCVGGDLCLCVRGETPSKGKNVPAGGYLLEPNRKPQPHTHRRDPHEARRRHPRWRGALRAGRVGEAHQGPLSVYDCACLYSARWFSNGLAVIYQIQTTNSPTNQSHTKQFIGVGETLEKLEPFYPDRMASRILGMVRACVKERGP